MVEYINTPVTRLSGSTKGCLKYNRITNCITEIPQDIKLELNEGTITLKAGSKVYIPNGFNEDGSRKFDTKIIENDLSGTRTGSGKEFLLSDKNGGVNFWRFLYSGNIAPTDNQYMVWYDTNSNIIKSTTDSGVTWINAYFSLPLCIYSKNTTGIDSIDQFFNGFGYIGGCTFVLPGLTYLIPNGFNPDGSYNNIIERVKEVTVNIGLQVESSTYCFLGITTTFPTLLYGYGVSWYFEQQTTPVLNSGEKYGRWLDTKNNFMMETNDFGATWNKVKVIYCGKLTKQANASITNFNPYNTIKLLDYNDTQFISTQSFPSGTYKNLTVGANNSSYIAPADGWVYFFTIAETTGGSYSTLYTSLYSVGIDHSRVNAGARLFIPVRKNEKFYIQYGSVRGMELRFIYSNGERYYT